MIKKVFLDTNIVIDFLDNKREDHPKVQLLIKKLTLNGYTIIISEDMISTIFYILKNKKATLMFFKIIIKKWEIVAYGIPLIEKAIDLALEKELDLEDLLQCLCAKENGCSILITKDKEFFNCGLTLYTTNDFLAS